MGTGGTSRNDPLKVAAGKLPQPAGRVFCFSQEIGHAPVHLAAHGDNLSEQSGQSGQDGREAAQDTRPL